MRVRITMPAKDGKRIKDKMLALISKVEDDEMGDEWEVVRAPYLDAQRIRLTVFAEPQ